MIYKLIIRKKIEYQKSFREQILPFMISNPTTDLINQTWAAFIRACYDDGDDISKKELYRWTREGFISQKTRYWNMRHTGG